VRDREAEVLCEEGDHLTADLQIGDVSIEQQPVDTVDLQADVTVQHSLMFTAFVMSDAIAQRDGLPARQPQLARGRVRRRPGGGLAPSR